MNELMLAAVNGTDLVHQLLYVLVIGICVAIVWWLGTKAIAALGAPAPTTTVWNYLFLLILSLAVINFLLSLIGHPMVKW